MKVIDRIKEALKDQGMDIVGNAERSARKSMAATARRNVQILEQP